MPNTVVKMPQLGESVSEGTIGRWLKNPGDRVELDEPLVEIQTDKVNAEVPSPVAGILQQILLPEGTTAAVRSDMAVIGDEAAAPAVPAAPATPGTAATAAPPPVENEVHATAEPGAKRFYTPVVLRMAEEHDLDLSAIEGSGAHGRVTRKDVERAIAHPQTRTAPAPIEDGRPVPETQNAAAISAAAPTRTAETAPPLGPPAAGRTDDTVPPVSSSGEDRALSPMRRAIAEHMTRARAEIPDAWSLVEIDLTSLVRQRQQLQPDWQAREGYELTYLPFFIKAVVAGLQLVPELNAAWAGDHVRVFGQHHLGIAVSLDNGLVVPVMRDADQLSVSGIARGLRSIVQKARGGRLSPDDLQGATFTVNNPGSLGSIMSQPIVPVGQAGIVTMEAVVKRPVVVAEDAIAVRSMMNCCLSFDHRVLDGAGALKFLRELKRQLETVEYPLY